MNKPILIFDGDCGFCTTAANYVSKRSRVQMRIIPWQFADLAALGLTKAQAQSKVQLVVSGETYTGHLCFAKLLELQPQPLRIMGAILRTKPFSWIAALGYWLVARYRHKLPGGTPACQLNNPD